MESLTLLRLHGLYQGTLHASFLKELTTTCHTYECKSTNAIFLLTSSLLTFLLWRIGINLLDILFFKGFEEVVVWHLVLVVEGYVHYFAWYLLATDLLLCVDQMILILIVHLKRVTLGNYYIKVLVTTLFHVFYLFWE